MVIVRRFWLGAVLLGAVIIGGTANAELRIEITGGVEQAVPIAVVPFGWQGDGSLPFDVSKMVSDDLARSGRFDPLTPDEMLERPTTGRDIDFDDWRRAAAGWLPAAGSQVTVYRGTHRTAGTESSIRQVRYAIAALR